MFIKDVCRECRLTKKAVEYYEEQGLISPEIGDNGYRNYSDDDITALKEIGVLRKLNISVAEIKYILSGKNKKAALAKYKYRMELEVEKSTVKKKCLEGLIAEYNINEAISYIENNIDKYFTIKEKLLQAFPGSFGMYLCVHFGQFLDGRIDTEEKENAYYKILDYLDRTEKMEFPDELEEYLQQVLQQQEQDEIERMNASILDTIHNIDFYLEDNEENIEEYLKFRNSEEFKSSKAFKMQQLLMQFQQQSGYNDILIPNLKLLSDSYREYFEMLQAANRSFIEKYPQAKDIYKL